MANWSASLNEALTLHEYMLPVVSGEVVCAVTDHTATRNVIQATFPEELLLSSGDAASRSSLQIAAIDGGAPLQTYNVTKGYDVLLTGTAGYLDIVGDDLLASDRFIIPVPPGDISFELIGNYLEILNGGNAGTYKIVGLITLDMDVPPYTVLVLERVLTLSDAPNGYVSGILTWISSGWEPPYYVNRFRLDNPGITEENPLIGVPYKYRRDGNHYTVTRFIVDPEDDHYIVNRYTPNGTWDAEHSTVFVVAQTQPRVEWRILSGVKRYLIETSKPTAGKTYELNFRRVTTKAGQVVDMKGYLPIGVDDVQRPRVIGASLIGDSGTILVEYDQPMQADPQALFHPGDYSVTGPTTVVIHEVWSCNPTTVALRTSGLGAGAYTLGISTGTPKDVAGNPVDPLWNAAAFTTTLPIITRSIYTDKGPIAKPPLTLQTGTSATLQTYNEVTLPGASLSVALIGKYVALSGGALNGGDFRIAAVLSATRARLANASFTLPDPASGSLTWRIYDPRHGQIADDPADVVVRINSIPVAADAVIGLLGQVVLSTSPAPTDDVKIDYSWVRNPTVEIRRLNSREFRLNAWNRDVGYPRDGSQHKYRYNNVLITPSAYDPDNMSAGLGQPLLREMHYRGYERAYTPVLNDPTLLLLNSPIHRIAYPPAHRVLSEQFVAYEGTGLPESQITNPWARKGSGTASSSGGHLTVIDATSGPYPTGTPIFWTRPIDVTFPHVFALSWRLTINSTTPDGVFTGVAAGYSDEKVALIVGYLISGGTKKLGILKRGYGDNPSALAAWTGGIDALGDPTGLPADFDWSALHSYRIFRDLNGTLKVFVDGEIDEILRVTPSELPYLEELSGPFDDIQGAFFGSLSRPAENNSTWDFVRYLIQPTNPKQTSASSFVSYEANVVPEQDAKPWTPVGFHGTETILSTDFLLLDSTSATDAATAADVGLVGGDYKGFVRFEPLLTESSELVVDARVQLLTHTHGVSPYALALAVDDGSRLMQVAFFPDRATPKISYGGRSFPQDFAPYNWQSSGTQPATMTGRILHIADGSITDGRVYSCDDTSPTVSDDRVVASSIDYMLEFRCRVVSFTVDGAGYAGAFAQVYDSARSVGALFEVIGGVRYVTFESDGTTLGALARFAFDWGDGYFHTYRLVKSTSGNLVSLFIDGNFIGSFTYSSFLAPAPDPIGQVSFGSSTPASFGAMSVVDWAYVNAWRVRSDLKHYVGLWKGSYPDSLLGYHLPLKASGKGATVVGNALGDGNADFIAQGVVAGDNLVVDDGANLGVYPVAAVISPTALTISGAWPAQPSLIDYRIVKETDWTNLHKYRLARGSVGNVSLLLDADPTPLISVGYNSIDLPESGVGIIRTLADNLPAVVFGSFDPENLVQSEWDFVRYGLTTSVTEQRIAPHHQFLNQWNVMESPERLFTILPHTLTDFKSSSTGNVPKTYPDLFNDAALIAFTQLNQSTPLVPQTQTFEVRAPYPVQEFVSALNRPEDVLNNDGDFTTNDGSKRFKLIVPNDVLYSSLDVIEQDSGENDLLAPFDDGSPNISGFTYTKQVCLAYEGNVLPEDDSSAPTPWQLISDNPAQVSTSVLGGALTYGTGGVGTRTVYRNNTPLPDHPSLVNEIQFRLKVLNDSTGGTGATQIMFGFSAPGLTAALTFITTAIGERFVLVLDLNNGRVLGSATFDFLDGNFHTYRLVRDPGRGYVHVFIDS